MSSRLSAAAAASFLALIFAAGARAKSNETVLYDFANQDDGRNPTGVTLDAQGDVFGTATWGGPGTCGGSGCGEVFELVRAQGGWTFQTIHAFQGSTSDGGNPSASVVFDAQGNLYGTASGGGTGNCGVVFELSPQAGGTWNETILYNFKPPGSGSDGCIPESRLVFDAAGSLYGTTYFGGGGNVEHTGCESGCGTVFRLSPKAGGVWKETVLHVFHGTQTFDGTNPSAGVVFDSKGNLWGTTTRGGTQTRIAAPSAVAARCSSFRLRRRADGTRYWSTASWELRTPAGRPPPASPSTRTTTSTAPSGDRATARSTSFRRRQAAG